VLVTNDGPSPAANIVLSASAPGAQSVYVNNRPIGMLDSGQSRQIYVSFGFAKPEARTLRMTFTAISETPDPNLANNTQSQDDVAVAFARLDAGVTVDSPYEPGLPANVSFSVFNDGLAPADNTTLELQLPDAGSLLELNRPAGVSCTSTRTTAHCTAGTLGVRALVTIRATVLMPDAYDGGLFLISALARTTSPTIDQQLASADAQLRFDPLFLVTTAADDGPGSLRQAMTDANARCVTNCRIGFRIAPSPLPNDVATIRVATPLPRLTESVRIDGTSQKTFLQRKDAGHPIVMLDGSAMREGGGVEFAAVSGGVIDVALGNFPGTAIALLPRGGNYSLEVRSCFIGTDASGLVAAPNERGIIAAGTVAITSNIISANRRSAVWLQGGAHSAVEANAIGVASDGMPMPNGGSGIYIAPGTVEPRIAGNVIANNGEFGIAIHPSVQRVVAAHNTIRDNALFGIDYGLDLATLNVAIDIGRAPNKPLLTSAHYDTAKQKTIVDGDLLSQPDRSNRFSIVFYSNRGDVNAQAEKEAGEVVVSGSGHFTAELSGDLRGRFLTAVTVRAFRLVPDEGFAITEDTSEISAPIPVAP
jgi:hypothetical protein